MARPVVSPVEREGELAAVAVLQGGSKTGKVRPQTGRVGASVVERLKAMHANGEIKVEWAEGVSRDRMRHVARIVFEPVSYSTVEAALRSLITSAKPAYALETVRAHFRRGGLVPAGSPTWDRPDFANLKMLVHSADELRRRDEEYAMTIERAAARRAHYDPNYYRGLDRAMAARA